MPNKYVYETFNSEYQNYYNILDADFNSGNDPIYSYNSFSNEVENIKNHVNSIFQNELSWQGESKAATDMVMQTLKDKFNCLSKNIDENLKAASNAFVNLHDELSTLKSNEEMLISKKADLDELLANEPDTHINVEGPNRTTISVANEPTHGNWVKRRDELNTEIMKLEDELKKTKKNVDKYISIIKAFESSMYSFYDFARTADGMFNDGYHSSKIDNIFAKFMSLSFEDKYAYLNEIADRYNDVCLAFKSFFDKNYKQGLSFNKENGNIDDLLTFFEMFGLNYTQLDGDKIETNKLFLDFSGMKYVSDVYKLKRLIDFCDATKFFDKVQSYLNGNGYEKSGLADVLGISEDELKKNMFTLGFGEVTDIKERFEYELTSNWEEIKKAYDYAKDECNTYSSLEEIYSKFLSSRNCYREAAKIAPYVKDAHTDEFLDFKNNYDSSKYSAGDIQYSNQFDYMTVDEKIQFYYYYGSGDDAGKIKAEKYLDAMKYTLYEREGEKRAIEKLNKYLSDGYSIGDLVGNFVGGVGNGVVNYTESIVRAIPGTEIYSVQDYEELYYTKYLVENYTDYLNKTYVEVPNNDLINGTFYDNNAYISGDVNSYNSFAYNPNMETLGEVLETVPVEDRQKILTSYNIGEAVGRSTIPIGASALAHLIAGETGSKITWAGLAGVSTFGETRTNLERQGINQNEVYLRAGGNAVVTLGTELIAGDFIKEKFIVPKILNRIPNESVKKIAGNILGELTEDGIVTVANIPLGGEKFNFIDFITPPYSMPDHANAGFCTVIDKMLRRPPSP